MTAAGANPDAPTSRAKPRYCGRCSTAATPASGQLSRKVNKNLPSRQPLSQAKDPEQWPQNRQGGRAPASRDVSGDAPTSLAKIQLASPRRTGPVCSSLWPRRANSECCGSRFQGRESSGNAVLQESRRAASKEARGRSATAQLDRGPPGKLPLESLGGWLGPGPRDKKRYRSLGCLVKK